MVEICAIASGSNGNCYYVGNETEGVLIDAGISTRQIKKRMKSLGLDFSKVKAVFISHEHSDHICGFRVLCDQNGIQGYITQRTMFKARKDFIPSQPHFFKPGDSIQIGDMLVHSFAKFHDGVEPSSFRVELEDLHIGVMTDIGQACKEVKEHMAQCHAVFLESNYDEQMLREGNYPYYLKERITSGEGHISNRQAFELVEQLPEHSPLQTVILSHLSKENNHIDLAIKAFDAVANQYTIVPTSRYAPGEIIRLGANKQAMQQKLAL